MQHRELHHIQGTGRRGIAPYEERQDEERQNTGPPMLLQREKSEAPWGSFEFERVYPDRSAFEAEVENDIAGEFKRRGVSFESARSAEALGMEIRSSDGEVVGSLLEHESWEYPVYAHFFVKSSASFQSWEAFAFLHRYFSAEAFNGDVGSDIVLEFVKRGVDFELAVQSRCFQHREIRDVHGDVLDALGDPFLWSYPITVRYGVEAFAGSLLERR